jgi:hypothetical protein
MAATTLPKLLLTTAVVQGEDTRNLLHRHASSFGCVAGCLMATDGSTPEAWQDPKIQKGTIKKHHPKNKSRKQEGKF